MAVVVGIEPITEGKAILHTSYGDLNLEFWPKQAPLAVRNFIQLAMEGYYDGTIFHRIIKDMMVQGGDPTGTGYGGESIYGEDFKDEFNSRLRFNHRGLLAMANSNKPNTNGSQFFITLAGCEWLTNKHTIFGKIPDETFYNCLRMGDLDTDGDDRPVFPPVLKSITIVENPFPDIQPRKIQKVEEKHVEVEKKPKKLTKNMNLLSFGDELEELEEIVKTKHCILCLYEETRNIVKGVQPAPSIVEEERKRKAEEEEIKRRKKEEELEQKEQKRKEQEELEQKEREKQQEEAKRPYLKKTGKELVKDMYKMIKQKTKQIVEKREEEARNEHELSIYSSLMNKSKYMTKKEAKEASKKNTRNLLEQFRLKLNRAWEENPESSTGVEEGKVDEKTSIKQKKDIESDSDSEGSGKDTGWMTSQLKFTKHQDDERLLGFEFKPDDYVTIDPLADSMNSYKYEKSKDSYSRDKEDHRHHERRRSSRSPDRRHSHSYRRSDHYSSSHHHRH